MPKDSFLATVNRYNELYDKQDDEDYGKEAFRLSGIHTPPFYGCWFGGSILTTLDGLKINADMQVLDKKMEPIAGLYAAGDCSGSMFSGNYPEYLVGCAVGRTMTQGRHAVRYINENE
ncbi:FAD-binding protein [Raoultibacter phocaeensis]|uniref:FAD-binding protein n=1 Tax=Raoultibacter phocaeensis TaxID=2479841 RepID=UPI00210853C7|nr:FAD-binding protein [Raoultibacter phocaeensis]